jgi:thioredoxin 1
VLREVVATLGPRIAFFRVNIATEHKLASSYQIQGTPTLIMFQDGEEVSRVEGPDPTVRSIVAAVTQPFGL